MSRSHRIGQHVSLTENLWSFQTLCWIVQKFAILNYLWFFTYFHCKTCYKHKILNFTRTDINATRACSINLLEFFLPRTSTFVTVVPWPRTLITAKNRNTLNQKHGFYFKEPGFPSTVLPCWFLVLLIAICVWRIVLTSRNGSSLGVPFEIIGHQSAHATASRRPLAELVPCQAEIRFSFYFTDIEPSGN